MSTVEIALTLFGLLLSVAGGYVALRLRPLEDADAAADRRISGIHDDMKEDREKFDRRIIEIEKSYLSRADLTAAIKDLRDGMDKSADRIESIVRALGAKVDHLSERVGKVEAAP